MEFLASLSSVSAAILIWVIPGLDLFSVAMPKLPEGRSLCFLGRYYSRYCWWVSHKAVEVPKNLLIFSEHGTLDSLVLL